MICHPDLCPLSRVVSRRAGASSFSQPKRAQVMVVVVGARTKTSSASSSKPPLPHPIHQVFILFIESKSSPSSLSHRFVSHRFHQSYRRIVCLIDKTAVASSSSSSLHHLHQVSLIALVAYLAFRIASRRPHAALRLEESLVTGLEPRRHTHVHTCRCKLIIHSRPDHHVSSRVHRSRTGRR